MNAWRGLLAAFGYFTVLPVPRWVQLSPPDAAALAWLPFVGAVVGGLAGALGTVAGALLPTAVAGPLAFALWVWLTGAIHVDGFLDSCDGLLASASPERRREILKDPRHGTFAVAGAITLGALWLGAIGSLLPTLWPAAFAFAAVTARVAAVTNAYVLPYAAEGASAATFASRPAPVILLAAFALAAGLAWALAPGLLLAIPLAVAASLGIGHWAAGRLGGGLTGDVYGAIVTLLEAGLLAGVASMR